MKNQSGARDPNLQAVMDLHGRAMLDYLDGSREAFVVMHREDGFAYPPIPAARWFYEGGFPILDSKALALCRGRVLNIGAASGSHSRFLEEQGLDVVSLEASPNALEVMRRRGVRQPVLGDLDSLGDELFDTLLLLCGTGVTGSLDGLNRFLGKARKSLQSDGLLITDCTDPRADSLEASQRYCDLQKQRGKYEGERLLRFEYGDSWGAGFNGWLSPLMYFKSMPTMLVSL